jgi:glycosyltransferase involved in cell wall biosynthesis
MENLHRKFKLFFVVHDHSGARTYADQLLSCLRSYPQIKVTKVFYESRSHSEFFIDPCRGEIHIPPVNNRVGELDKYARRCADLLFPFIIGKEEIVFHLNYNTQSKLANEVKHRFNAKIVYTLHFLPDYFSYLAHNNSWDTKLITTGDALERELFETAHRVITVTRFAKKSIDQVYNISESKSIAIHNGFSPAITAKTLQPISSEKCGFTKKDQIILYAGALEDRKGVKELVEVFNVVADKCPRARLVIAGSGNFDEVMGSIQSNWGRITFTGNIPYPLLAQLYRTATIGVIPSVFEQCSYVALEMMSYGLPVVVNNAPGLTELYTHLETGWVVPLMRGSSEKLKLKVDIKAFADGIIEMIGNEQLRKKIARNSRQRWEKCYSAERMCMETLNEYKKLINE